MDGKIIAYSESVKVGVITGFDGKAYYFIKQNWMCEKTGPTTHQAVTFDNNRGEARNIRNRVK